MPVPAGSSADDWAVNNEVRPFRLIWGPQHAIDGDAVVVRVSAAQYADGAIDETDGDGPAIHIDVCRDWGISTKHAREVAAADEAERLVTVERCGACDCDGWLWGAGEDGDPIRCDHQTD
jgi:hypothetical protein